MSGVVVWEGASPVDGAPIVMIVTGIDGKSANRKTGDMAQSWILRADIAPVDALKSGVDASICGDCPLRGSVVDGKRVGRACYVNVGQAPQSVWKAYKRGSYARVSPLEAADLLEGKGVRLGSYGDPAMVPLAVLLAVVSKARMWTGYTHQWRTIDPVYAGLLMASADSVEDRRAAREAGWRSFYVVPATTEALPAKAMVCAADRERNPLQCSDCGACAGTRQGSAVNAVDVVIRAHGGGAKYVKA